VNLVEIHVIRAQPPQAIVDGVKDVLARESPEVGIVAHRLVNLGGDHNSVAAAGEIAESPPHDLLANPDRIHIGGIEKIDPEFQSALQERPRLLLLQYPLPPLLRPVSHRAQTQARYHQSSPSEIHVFHLKAG
jgi:hypothetical protein